MDPDSTTNEPPAPIYTKRTIRELDWQDKDKLKAALRDRCKHPRGFLTEHLVEIAYPFLGFNPAGFSTDDAKRLSSIYVNNFVSAEKKAGRVMTKPGDRTRPQRYFPSGSLARQYIVDVKATKEKFDRDRAAFVTSDLAKGQPATV